jgi:hypothetical protein
MDEGELSMKYILRFIWVVILFVISTIIALHVQPLMLVTSSKVFTQNYEPGFQIMTNLNGQNGILTIRSINDVESRLGLSFPRSINPEDDKRFNVDYQVSDVGAGNLKVILRNRTEARTFYYSIVNNKIFPWYEDHYTQNFTSGVIGLVIWAVLAMFYFLSLIVEGRTTRG